MEQNIDALIVKAESYMDSAGYTPKTIKLYKTAWNKASKLCKQWGCADAYGPDAEEAVLSELGSDNYESLTKAGKMGIRAVRSLLTIEKTGQMPKAAGHPMKYVVPDRFLPVLDDYRAHMEDRGLNPHTITRNLLHVRALLSHIAASSIRDMTVGEVERFAASYATSNPQTHAGALYALRAFLRFATARCGCDPALASLFPVIPGHKRHRLPSTYTAEEVSAAVGAATPPAASLRDAAMVTLVAQTGVRVGDVRALRIGDIDWGNNRLTFTQSKTGVPQSLPMTAEIRYSLIDYLANERPRVEDDHVFTSSRAPLRSFADTQNSFHYVASSSYLRAGVDPRGRHHGMHSLRHSLAARMLGGGTPLPVITGVLGHMSSNTTRRYLEIDVERLRDLALEVPRG